MFGNFAKRQFRSDDLINDAIIQKQDSGFFEVGWEQCDA
jgi:hypothetical protein